MPSSFIRPSHVVLLRQGSVGGAHEDSCDSILLQGATSTRAIDDIS